MTADPPSPGTTPASPDDGSHVKRGRRRLAVTVVVAAVVVVGFVAYRWFAGSARPVDVGDVTRPTGSTLPVQQAVLRPPQGVYLYRGSGTDQLDVPPKSQSQGPDMPASVTHRPDGCWTFRIDYSTNHWQTWDYCPRDGGLDEVGGTTFQRWDFGVYVNESTSTFTCVDSPTIKAKQEPGDVWQQSCSGTTTGTEGTTNSAGPYRYVGDETLHIGTERVTTHRYHRERTTSGNQSGSEQSDVWFAADTGLPVRNERRIEARTGTVIGEVLYTEEGRFELTDLSPR